MRIVGQSEATARRVVKKSSVPTPPSDAGTSERETELCEVRTNIGEAMEDCGEPMPCFRHAPPAAPAAEGPRACLVCLDDPRHEMFHKPATLPGAEAGTPKADPTNELRVREEIIADLSRHLAALTSEVRALREAAVAMLDKYVGLANSGDAGFWNPEEDAEVIALRAALRKEATHG